MGNIERENDGQTMGEWALRQSAEPRTLSVQVPAQLAQVKDGVSVGLASVVRGTLPRTTRRASRNGLKTIRLHLTAEASVWLTIMTGDYGYSERGAIIEALSWVFEYRDFIPQVSGHEIEPDEDELRQRQEDEEAAAREAAEAESEADESAETNPVSHGKVEAETEAESEPESSEWDADDERE
ncbi:hypothetical protein SAMN05660831_02700 [Thiohalospira halophila DSM 15071]|uniref:Uncharacterized protein n=1 Tax=Thiohalospira halophila DSM 15071 TaxID=1123397 RepID=A0A1I1WNG5_9GAMM|nr:hypothetical protein SAMN05660831_02700 [Thiohalospira halophila DSM 15071]